jgi:hypothetical protein
VVPVPQPTPSHNVSQKVVDGKEVYHVGVQSANAPPAPVEATPTPAAPTLEIDDVNAPLEVGALCRRNGCNAAFVSDEVNRQGDGEGTKCRYHPLPPYFREGSKGYLCCKRRVLEFDEFLKIEGCQIGRHCFVPINTEQKTEAQVECRIDHYQTPEQVHVSVFAKKVDKDRSSIQFDDDRVTLDFFLPDNKRFSRTLVLFGAIDPSSSSYQFFGTKVELHLKKSDTRSWVVLEKTGRDLGNISLTFGVGGRTGTVGGKEIILDETNKARA